MDSVSHIKPPSDRFLAAIATNLNLLNSTLPTQSPLKHQKKYCFPARENRLQSKVVGLKLGCWTEVTVTSDEDPADPTSVSRRGISAYLSGQDRRT